MIDSHNILMFFHIILMGYWLGGDLGVYLAANQVSNPKLPLAERLNFLKLALKLDMAPRSALILMIPVGFHMAHNLGMVDLSSPILAVIWAASFIWLGLSWAVFLYEGHAMGGLIKQTDLFIRYIMLVFMVGYGLYALFINADDIAPWLALKFLFFGGIILLGLLLRIQVGAWAKGFQMLREQGPSPEAEDIILSSRKVASRQALTLWGFILICGFLGTTKIF